MSCSGLNSLFESHHLWASCENFSSSSGSALVMAFALIDEAATLTKLAAAAKWLRHHGKFVLLPSPACGITSDLAAVLGQLREWLVVPSEGLGERLQPPFSPELNTMNLRALTPSPASGGGE